MPRGAVLLQIDALAALAAVPIEAFQNALVGHVSGLFRP